MVRAGTQRLGATDRGADLRGRSSRGAARAQVPDSGVGSGWRSLPAGSGVLLWARFACAPTPDPSLKGRGMAWYFISLSFPRRSEEHTSELQSLMRISYAVFCLKKKKHINHKRTLQ